MKLKSSDVHDLLADIYMGFRGAMAPVNSQTESLWAKIELLEAEEGVIR